MDPSSLKLLAVAPATYSITVKNSLLTNKTDLIQVVDWNTEDETLNITPAALPDTITQYSASELEFSTDDPFFGTNGVWGYLTISLPKCFVLEGGQPVQTTGPAYVSFIISYQGGAFGYWGGMVYMTYYGQDKPAPTWDGGNVEAPWPYVPPGCQIPTPSPATGYTFPSWIGYKITISTETGSPDGEPGLTMFVNIQDPDPSTAQS